MMTWFSICQIHALLVQHSLLDSFGFGKIIAKLSKLSFSFFLVISSQFCGTEPPPWCVCIYLSRYANTFLLEKCVATAMKQWTSTDCQLWWKTAIFLIIILEHNIQALHSLDIIYGCCTKTFERSRYALSSPPLPSSQNNRLTFAHILHFKTQFTIFSVWKYDCGTQFIFTAGQWAPDWTKTNE